jgi:predicted glycoside hydrolase/deacetylase ChbG (UPF0249 family)
MSKPVTLSVKDGDLGEWTVANSGGTFAGVLIINADDWGRDFLTTDRTLDCLLRGTVSSVSAMVFMKDSERSADVAWERGIDAGLHLNLTTPFSSPRCPAGLAERQRNVAAYLRRNRFAQVVFNPLLVKSFEYVVRAQVDEYCRLYGAQPERIDGHHHMHLCANVIWGGLLPSGTTVRRNCSFQPSEKSLWNRLYRHAVDCRLARRHRMTDYFLSLVPFDPMGRLQQVFSLAKRHVVEVETHPVNAQEYRFLAGGEIFRYTGDLRIAPRYVAKANGQAKRCFSGVH